MRISLYLTLPLLIVACGEQKTEIALDVYCKCRAEFMSTNLTFKQLENIYYKKEQMDLNLFSKMETKCVKEIAHLLQ